MMCLPTHIHACAGIIFICVAKVLQAKLGPKQTDVGVVLAGWKGGVAGERVADMQRAFNFRPSG